MIPIIILSVYYNYFEVFDISQLKVYNLSKLTDWRTAYGIGELKLASGANKRHQGDKLFTRLIF